MQTVSKLLCFFIAFIVFLPFALTASAAEQPSATLVFASDYQYDSSSNPTQPSSTLTDILNQVYSSGETVDQAVFCGDYTNTSNYNYNADATSAISEINNIVDNSLGTSVATTFIQGNHDTWNASSMTATGAYEFDDYIIYIIDTQGYNPWCQGSTSAKATLQATASTLNTYLTSLIAAGDTRPVFVATHVPLHMSSRTSSLYSTGDNMYASYLFNVLNQAAEQLDIIYLYGHNHTHGWDSYLGGSCNYLPVGSTIYIPDCTGVTTAYTNKFTANTLNFTYMNAGYLGYDSGTTADETLTASVFDIYDDHVEISRYSTDGVYQLGAAGSYNTTSDNGAYNDSNGFNDQGTNFTYQCTASATASPQTVERINDHVYTPALTLTGGTDTANIGNGGTLTATLENGIATAYQWSSTDTSVAKITGTGQSVSISYNKAGTATVSCLATFNDGNGNETITQTYTVTVSAQDTYNTVTTYTKTTNITSGARYVIATNAGQALTYSGGSFSATNGTVSGNTWTLPSSVTDNAVVLWTLTRSGGKYTVQSNYNNQYLSLGNSLACKEEPSLLTFTMNTGYTIFGNKYLRYFNGSFSTNKNSYTLYLYQANTSTVQESPTATIVYSNGDVPSGTVQYGSSTRLFANVTNISEITGYSWSSSNNSVISLTNADSASPTANYVGRGDATISLTITYVDGTTKTISCATDTLTVEDVKEYQRISSVSDIVSGESYLLIWPQGDMVSHTPTTYGSTYTGLTPVAIDGTLNTTIYGDYTDCEWVITANGSYWNVGINGNNSGYLNLGKNYATLGSAANLTITDTNNFTITSTANYSLDRYNSSIYYGYANGSNRYGYIYKIVTQEEPTVESATADIRLGTRTITNVLQRRYSVTNGDTETLTAQYDHLTNATVSWSSSNTAVAVVNASGTLTYKGHTGYTRITMTVTGTNEAGETETLKRGVTYYVSTSERTASDNDYPDYPDEGAVRIDKTATGVDFQTTGVSQVELDLDGVSSVKGTDVVVVLDMSSSMTDSIDGTTRVDIMHDSLETLAGDLLEANPDGTTSQNRVSIVAFNNYDYYKNTGNYTNTVDYSVSSENTSGFRENGVYPILTGNSVNDAFMDASETTSVDTVIDTYCTSTYCKSGTNYDYGLMYAYKILAAAKSEANYDRKQTVVFMSDGCPYQYNYFRGFSGTGDVNAGTNWMAWLSGNSSNSVVANLLSHNQYASAYFNEDGTNWWADAIKSTSANNMVIDPYAGSASNKYIRNVDGLGASVYSVGFCLENDAEVTVASEQNTLRGVSSGSSYLYTADSASELTDVFQTISTNTAYAATNAVVSDAVGAAFNIQYASTLAVNSTEIDLTDSDYIGSAPYIEIGEWSLDDAGRRVSYTTKEKVTFVTDSGGNLTAAYSTLLSGNIYSAGSIRGSTFTLNVNTEALSWNIGTICGNTQYTAKYFVYLAGSLEGTCGAGSYATNSTAVVNYTNYRDVNCTKYFPVPQMPWQAVDVTYEYYLVNHNGEPINNSGAVVSFADRIVYYSNTKTIYLNSGNEFEALSLSAAANLPSGFGLYNDDTVYYIDVGSGSNPSYAYMSDDESVQTTFVYSPANAGYTAAAKTIGGVPYNYEVTGLTDYTNTHVAFAVAKVPELTSINAVKVWDDSDDATGERPDEVSAQLYADGEAYGSPVILNDTNEWSYQWNHLTKYVYENGLATATEVNYSVVETPVDHYLAHYSFDNSTDTWTITNTYGIEQHDTLQILKNDIGDYPLTGAGFMLYEDESCTSPAKVYLDSGETVSAASAGTDDLLTNEQGLMNFYGLTAGTYYLKEIYTPKGYSLLNDTITVTIAEDQTVTVSNATDTYSPIVENGVIKLTITDQELELNMPEAGENGIYTFITVGSALMVLSILLILVIKRRKQTEPDDEQSKKSLF